MRPSALFPKNSHISRSPAVRLAERPTLSRRRLRSLGPSLACLLSCLFACQGTPEPTPPPAAPQAASAQPADADAARAEALAQQYAQRAEQGLAQSPPADTAKPPRDGASNANISPVVWLEDAPAKRPTRAPAETAPQPVPQPAQPRSPAPGPTPAANPPAAQPLDRKALLESLRRQLASDPDPAVVRALNQAALSVLLGETETPLDPRLLASLTPERRRQVERYQRLISELARQIASSDQGPTRGEVNRHLDAIFGREPLTIEAAHLVKRVRGFGVIDPFPDYRFIAGRSQPLIVYVELANFTVVPSSTDPALRQVVVTQELTLYNESDGLRVWHEEPVRILDESRNVRRDFFMIQHVTLPANLSVGRYQLKISVRDVNGRSVDEANLPIQIVAQLPTEVSTTRPSPDRSSTGSTR